MCLNPENMGFSIVNGRIRPGYLDFGSSSHGPSIEPEDVTESIYPSTLLYVSSNKVPDPSDPFEFEKYISTEDENLDLLITINHTFHHVSSNIM